MCRFWLLSLVVFSFSSTAFAAEGLPPTALDAVKGASVYVKVKDKAGLHSGSGSGFLIRVDKGNGLVVTCRHVVTGMLARVPATCEVVFGSGTRAEQRLPATLVAADAERDLAILRVTADALPAPFALDTKAELRETETLYIFGFPLGDRLAFDRGNPAVTVGKGFVGRLDKDEDGRARLVQIDGELNPGNSGGPVVNDQGKLVGIAVGKIAGTKISFGIGLTELNEMLGGRAGGVILRTATVTPGTAEVRTEAPVIDALGKLKAVEIRVARKDTVTAPPRPQKGGGWTTLPGEVKEVAKVANGTAVAAIKLTAADKQPVEFYFQCVYTDAEGNAVGTRPDLRAIDFTRAGVARLDAAPPWYTYTSKIGGFTIDLPTRPVLRHAEKRNTPAGVIQQMTIGSVTERGVYMLFRTELPVAVPAGAEARIHNAQRDSFAAEWQGKVLTEKNVRAQGSVGRDFTIRGKPDGRFVATIRVRQYLIGRTLYALAVFAPPEEELPEDAGRFLGSLALGEALTRATGTPEPELTGVELKGWGQVIDPDKDCNLTPDAKGLSVKIPGKLHDLFFDGGPTNAPRVLREVDGDFTVTVKVVGEFKPGPKSTNPKSVPFHGAGILLWSDSDNNIRFERFSWMRGGRFTTGALFEEREGGYGGANHTEQFPEGNCWLRVERTGSRIVGSISSDGRTWKQLKPVDTVWPTKLKVGLTAITTSSQPFVVRFEEFVLKTGQ